MWTKRIKPVLFVWKHGQKNATVGKLNMSEHVKILFTIFNYPVRYRERDSVNRPKLKFSITKFVLNCFETVGSRSLFYVIIIIIIWMYNNFHVQLKICKVVDVVRMVFVISKCWQKVCLLYWILPKYFKWEFYFKKF